MTTTPCVYLTVYRGNKLPPFYIGSSTVERIQHKNYNGSVSSRVYKNIWNSERIRNPHLFKTIIIKTFETREEATLKEFALQKFVDAPNNPLYINRSFARNIPGYEGKFHPLRGVTSPLKGRRFKRSEEGKKNISIGARKRPPMSDEQRAKIGASQRGRKSPMDGKKHTEDSKLKMSVTRKGNTWNAGKKISELKPNWIDPRKGKSGNPMSIEARHKMSVAHLNRVRSDEHIKNQKLAVSGANSNTALVIDIFDENGNLRHTTHGNFIQYCIDNGLPESALRISYRNGGTPIKMAHHKNMDVPFRGWYAIKRVSQ